MIKETGGQAFPRQQCDYDGQNNVLQYQEEGMTLRDYFAAKAMQGVLSNPLHAEALAEVSVELTGQMKLIAPAAYEMADAMLKARGEKS